MIGDLWDIWCQFCGVLAALYIFGVLVMAANDQILDRRYARWEKESKSEQSRVDRSN
jgi:hypothetical protein